MTTLTDAALARRLLERAIANTTAPALDAATVDDLLMLAASTDAEGNTVYTDADLDRAAALGWQMKAGLTSNQYDLGGGAGVTLDRSQWFAHCVQMSERYASGAMSVLGARLRRGGIGSIGLVTPATAETGTAP